MIDLTHNELKVLGYFAGGCETIGKVSGVNDAVWLELERKGLIEKCDCCDDGRSFVITSAGEKAK